MSRKKLTVTTLMPGVLTVRAGRSQVIINQPMHEIALGVAPTDEEIRTLCKEAGIADADTRRVIRR